MKPIRRLVSIAAIAAGLASSTAHADDLLEAVKAGDADAVGAAVAAGADVNRPDLSGTALHVAVATGNLEIVEALIAAGAELEAVGEPAGALPLHIAAQVNEPEIAGALVDHGAEVDARDTEGRTPLMVAIVNGSLDTVVLLLEKGADPKAKDAIYHDVPVHFASWSGRPDVLELLLSGGADLNQANPQTGWTALHYASMEDSAAAIEFLIANGADPGLRDSKGKTPLEVAKSPATAELLRKLGATE